jgi:hypothetical protein
MLKRSARAVCAACLPLLAAPVFNAPALRAQSFELQLLPRIGVATPLGRLTESTEMRTALAFGIAAELQLPALPFSVRANLDHIRAAGISERSAEQPVVGEADITLLVGDVVLRPFAATSAAAATQPYILAGAGVKRYRLRLDSRVDGELDVPHEISRLTVHLGGGADVRVGRFVLILEVADYLSTFVSGNDTSQLQHDVVGVLGLRVSLF